MSATISIGKLGVLADGDLVQSALAGRETSFEELVRRYQRPIAAYVYRMVGDYDAALDLTQEVFIKVYKSLTRYRSEFKFSTWIYKIAHNAAIDHLRRHAVREHSLTTGIDGERREHGAGRGVGGARGGRPVHRRRPRARPQRARAQVATALRS